MFIYVTFHSLVFVFNLLPLRLQVNPDSETSAAKDVVDPSSRLLQALNDQSPAAINECVTADDTKVWINNDVDPKQLVNPVVDFKDVESVTCLTFASLVNDFQTVRQLVESGSDVRVTDWTGCTPLHYACASRVEAQAKVEYMLQRDASLVNATNYSENAVLDPEDDASLWRYSTPLHVAARHGQTHCVKTLVDVGKAPVYATDGLGWTALHRAAEAGHAEAVEVLVQHPDCRVNATDEEGWTALHLAALLGRAEAVEVLVSHPRCDVSITDEYGDTAADLARGRQHGDIAALIEAKAKGKFRNYL